MSYIDCYLAPVPRANEAAYKVLAQLSAQVVKEYGAMRVVESWLDDLSPNTSSYHGQTRREHTAQYGSFMSAAGANADETVVLSWIEWPDKATRDIGMAKLTSDPRMQFTDMHPVFDGLRLIAAGFLPMLDSAD